MRTKKKTRTARSSRRPTGNRTPDIELGRIVGRFGVRGEVKIQPSRSGLDALRPGLHVRLDGVSAARALEVVATRRQNTLVLVRFEGVDATGADSLIGARVFVEREQVPLAEDEYFDADLLGCRVVDTNGNDIGDVVDLLHYPAQDLLVVGTRRTLIPMVGAFIRGIDVGAKRIDVELPEGLLE